MTAFTLVILVFAAVGPAAEILLPQHQRASTDDGDELWLPTPCSIHPNGIKVDVSTVLPFLYGPDCELGHRHVKTGKGQTKSWTEEADVDGMTKR